MDLSRLAEPFHADDIEWRVARSGMGPKGPFALVIPYITARAIQYRLDEVCGPENWRTEAPMMIEVGGRSSFAVGIAICVPVGDRGACQWITKWDVADPTNIEPAKGGFSGAMKRAGAQWGIGRYLYYLPETFAEVQEQGTGREWNYAKLPEKHGGGIYYWKTPSLPGWALPKEPEHEVSVEQLNELKRAWKAKFGADLTSPAELREGFSLFVTPLVGYFPMSDNTCWTADALLKCTARIKETTGPGGVSPDVPFEE
jgi:hypothetical protein